MTTAAALVAAVLLAVVGIFQLALALGAPLGDVAWGGQHRGVLPRPLRIASGVAGLAVYPAAIGLVLAAAGLIDDAWLPLDGGVVMWLMAGLLAVGALANLASRSPRERYWGPVALIIAVCCAIVAIGPF